MLEHSFKVEYIRGEDNILGDWASRYYARINRKETKVNEINSEEHWALEQDKDNKLRDIRQKLITHKLNKNKRYKGEIILDNNVLKYILNDQTDETKELYIVPEHIKRELLEAAHGNKLAAHYATNRTKDKLMQNYWWPDMQKEVEKFIEKCEECQKGTNPNTVRATPLKPLPQEDEPNHRVHMDLFGPLISDNAQRYICVCTDSFMKFTHQHSQHYYTSK